MLCYFFPEFCRSILVQLASTSNLVKDKMAQTIWRFSARSLSLVEKTCCFSGFRTSTFIPRHINTITSCPNRILVPTTTSFIPVKNYGSKRVSQKIKKGYSSASDSESDDEHEHRPRAESEFWRRKMRTIHNLLDINKDGVISFDDFTLLSDKFVNLGHLSAKESNDFQLCIKQLWESQWGEVTPYNLVTVEQYLEDMHHVLNDKTLKKKVHSFLPYLFKAVDKDQSGEISVEEFKLFFECLGIDEVHAIASFSLIDTNNDGKLSIKEFIKHGRDYFLTENETKVSKVFWGPLVQH